jgi:hypothetical protein
MDCGGAWKRAIFGGEAGLSSNYQPKTYVHIRRKLGPFIFDLDRTWEALLTQRMI